MQAVITETIIPVVSSLYAGFWLGKLHELNKNRDNKKQRQNNKEIKEKDDKQEKEWAELRAEFKKLANTKQ